jgi:hypothetical protein
MAVEGRAFPGGTYRIARQDNEALCEAVGASPDPDGRAHPIFYYVATQVGMGMTVAELLALCDFDVADGPMMTGSNASFDGELMVETDYRVAGEIVSLTRKPSRTFGFADILRFRLTLSREDERPTLECINEWILPRGGKDAS